MSRRSQPYDGTYGKTSWRFRNGASIYFTSCSADSVTWPSASMTVMVASFPLGVAGSGLLADHVEQRLALLLPDDAQRSPERRRQCGGVLHALGVAAGGPADQLVVGRGLEVGEHHRAGLRRPAVRRQALHRPLHRVPRAVVEDDEEHGDVVRARDEMRRGRRAEDRRTTPVSSHHGPVSSDAISLTHRNRKSTRLNFSHVRTSHAVISLTTSKHSE